MIEQTYHFQCIIAHYQLFVQLFMCNIVAKFTLVQIIFIMPLLKCFDLSLQCFYIMVDQVCVGFMLPQNYLCYRLPTRGRAGVKLGDADTYQTYLLCLMLHACFLPIALCFPHVFSSFFGCFHRLTY